MRLFGSIKGFLLSGVAFGAPYLSLYLLVLFNNALFIDVVGNSLNG